MLIPILATDPITDIAIKFFGGLANLLSSWIPSIDLTPQALRKLILATSNDLTGSMIKDAGGLYGDILNPVCTAIAKTMLPLILWVETSFCGFRIMEGKPILAQVGKMLLVSLICYVIIFAQLPQRVLINAMEELSWAGRRLGSEIIIYSNLRHRTFYYVPLAASTSASAAPTLTAVLSQPYIDYMAKNSAVGMDTIMAWNLWIDPTQQHASDSYKYGYLYLRNVVFSETMNARLGTVPTYRETAYYSQVLGSASAANRPDAWDAQFDYNPGPGGPADVINHLSSQLLTFAPLTAFAMAIPIAASITVGQITPMMTTATVLGASYYAFFIVLALGVTIVPLTYFESFKTGWQVYLKFLVGACMVPMFYYIFAAIGFFMATSIYAILFPIDHVAFSALYGSVFKESLTTAYAVVVQMNGMSQSGGEALVKGIVGLFFKIFAVLGRQTGGCVLITGIIEAGCAFAVYAIKISFQWHQGFAAEHLYDGFTEMFNSIRSKVATSFSMRLSTGMEQFSRMTSGFLGDVQGLLKK